VERGGTNHFAAALASTLDWWAEAGVDCLVADHPRNWLKPAAPLPSTPDAPLVSSEVERRPNPSARLEPFEAARGGAQDKLRRETLAPTPTAPIEPLPNQLDLLQSWLKASDTLPYAAPSAPRICPSGDASAGLMILAPMPSTDDCAAGTLLSGPAGRLFDRMLAAIGRGRDTAYLAGLSCFRPPAGRFDAPGAARCAELARHHLALAAPRAVLLLGDDTAKALLGLGAAQARGRVHAIDTPAGAINAVVTFTPDFLLKQPTAKARAWEDLQLLMETLS